MRFQDELVITALTGMGRLLERRGGVAAVLIAHKS